MTLYIIDTVCCDDGCHLKKYACNKRAELTAISKKISTFNIVVDKMHFKGHTDDWCKANCNPYNLEHLNTVRDLRTFKAHFILSSAFFQIDTEVCEQTFSWLSRCACITRHMNKAHFLFYILYLCDLHNRKK